jgi:hypothetical protein
LEVRESMIAGERFGDMTCKIHTVYMQELERMAEKERMREAEIEQAMKEQKSPTHAKKKRLDPSVKKALFYLKHSPTDTRRSSSSMPRWRLRGRNTPRSETSMQTTKALPMTDGCN